MLRVHMATITVAAMMIATVGCGESTKSTPAAGTMPSKMAKDATSSSVGAGIPIHAGRPLARTAWISRGDAICTRIHAKLSSTTVKSAEDSARLLPQAAAYDHLEATELSQLVPPVGKETDWQTIVNGIQKISELAMRSAEYAQTKNYQAAEPIAVQANAVQHRYAAIAKRDGFKECSFP
jgi:hypothetical protein